MTDKNINIEKFDIEAESKSLKEIVSKFDSEKLLSDISDLLTQIDSQGILLHPFQGLDSPLRQLLYVASLSISSNKEAVVYNRAPTTEEWKKIIFHVIRAKAGYFDLFLPKEEDDKVEYYKFYQVAMPVFMNYFDAGSLNFEEQEIERIERLFQNFNTEIEGKFSLTVKDFINIYNLIDETFNDKLNRVFNLMRDDNDCKEFCNKQKENNTSPRDWTYEGSNGNIKEVILFFKDIGEKHKIDKTVLYSKVDANKIDAFFELFSVEKKERDFLYYTQKNPIEFAPLFRLADNRYLAISTKQILHAIYNLLEDFCLDKSNKMNDRFVRNRGNKLQAKTEEIFATFLKKDFHIHNEYTITQKGDGQDILILYKGVCLIIETKAGKEPTPPSAPKDTRKVYEIIYRKFKNDMQEGYKQAYRIKKLFDTKTDFDIYDKHKNLKHRVRTKNYHSVFSLIVTEKTYRKPQIDLSLLLELEATDNLYPFSVSIDDLEIILLTLRKLKMSVADFIHFLTLREKLQGRLECNDELELWGAFIHNKKFSVPDEPDMHFKTFPEMTDIYDDLYIKGLGFKNEKYLDKKKSGRWKFMEPISRSKFSQRKPSAIS